MVIVEVTEVSRRLHGYLEYGIYFGNSSLICWNWYFTKLVSSLTYFLDVNGHFVEYSHIYRKINVQTLFITSSSEIKINFEALIEIYWKTNSGCYLFENVGCLRTVRQFLIATKAKAHGVSKYDMLLQRVIRYVVLKKFLWICVGNSCRFWDTKRSSLKESDL